MISQFYKENIGGRKNSVRKQSTVKKIFRLEKNMQNSFFLQYCTEQFCRKPLESVKAQEIQVFNLTSHTHFALHALQFSRFVHPYLVWCYNGDTTMHRGQVLWKSFLTG